MQTMRTTEVIPVLDLSKFKHIIRIKPRPRKIEELAESKNKRRKETSRERIRREMKEEEQKRPPYNKPVKQP